MVIAKKENYVILFDGVEKLYFKTNDVEIDLFDVISVNGEFIEFENYRKPIESGFNFEKYLAEQGVFREIKGYHYTTIFNNRINIVQFKTSILSQFTNEKSRLIVKTLLLGQSDYDNELYTSLKSGGLLVLLSSSGLILNGLYYSFASLLEKK